MESITQKIVPKSLVELRDYFLLLPSSSSFGTVDGPWSFRYHWGLLRIFTSTCSQFTLPSASRILPFLRRGRF